MRIQDDDVGKYLIAIGLLDAAGGLKKTVEALAADVELVTGLHPSATVFTNRGATAPVTVTLPIPVPAIAGTSYEFLAVDAQSITLVVRASEDGLMDPLPLGTAGPDEHAIAICDGVEWLSCLDPTPVGRVRAKAAAKKKGRD